MDGASNQLCEVVEINQTNESNLCKNASVLGGTVLKMLGSEFA